MGEENRSENRHEAFGVAFLSFLKFIKSFIRTKKN
jgi:hypothetical protein